MREDILREADRLMRIGGYGGLNFGTIAGSLGTTRANLHYHFKNKESLAQAVVDHYVAHVQARVVRLTEAHPGDFPRIMLALHDDLWETLTTLDYQGHCVCSRVAVEQSVAPGHLRHKAEEHFTWLITAFSRAIALSQSSGTLCTHRPAADLAREALAVYLGVAQVAMSIPQERLPGSRTRRTIPDWVGGL